MNGLNEIWVPVKAFSDRYEVSNTGKVRSLYCPTGLRKKPHEKVLQEDKDGYFVVGLYHSNTMKMCKVHRLVAEAFVPNPESKNTVNHKDTNKKNNNPENLEWVTSEENTKHARKMGCYPRCDGDFASYRIFTTKEIAEIKKDIVLGKSSKELFNKYPKLNSKHLYLLRHNKTWKSVQPVTT